MRRQLILSAIILCGLVRVAGAQEIRKDSLRGYQVKVPAWLSVVWASEKLFGGSLPEVDSVENTILVCAFGKKEFKSFNQFKDIYIRKNKFGEPTLYSKEHTWYGSSRELQLPNGGLTSRVFTIFKNVMYHNQFVLLETKTAYLWIQFSASPDTYEINLPKFDEFMAGLTIL